MPQKMKMFLPSTSQTLSLSQINNSNFSNAIYASTTNNLRSPIIGRIHKARPGCGSCGRH